MPDYINNLINVRVGDLIFEVKADEVSKEFLNYVYSNFDDEFLRRLAIKVKQFRIMAADDYFLFYSMFPKVRQVRNPDPLLEAVREAMLTFTLSRHYRSIKALTTLNDGLSKVHALTFLITLLRLLAKMIEEQEERESGGGGGSGSECGGGGSGGLSRPTAGGGKVGARGRSLTDSLRGLLGSSGMRDVLVSVAEMAFGEAVKSVSRADVLVRVMYGSGRGVAYGCGTAASPLRLSDIIDSVLDVRFQKVIDVTGRLVDFMPRFTVIDKEVSKFGDEVMGYRLTGKPWEALGRNYALPDDVFEARILSKSLLAVEKAEVREGAYYVMVDASGSMRGLKMVWAKSVALALHKSAVMRGRKYFLRFFNYTVFPKGSPISEPDEILRYLRRVRAAGGTSIDNALSVMIRDISVRGLRRYTNTGIIITDGIAQVKTLPEELRRNNIRLIAIMILGHNKDLMRLARGSGGKYFSVEPSVDSGSLIVREVMQR